MAKSPYLLLFLGSPQSPRMAQWLAMPEAERQQKAMAGIAAWKSWQEKYGAEIGGPIGKTKKVSTAGTEDISNMVSGFAIIHAESHEAAAKTCENHPHFVDFPGDCVEIMPIMPIPEG